MGGACSSGSPGSQIQESDNTASNLENEKLQKLRDICFRDPGKRGIAPLTEATPADFSEAAKILSVAQEVLVITGFPCKPGLMKPETDGPLGALWVAHALHVNGCKVRIVTDSTCGPVTKIGLDKYEEISGNTIDLISVDAALGKEEVKAILEESMKDRVPDVVISVERVGVTGTGDFSNMGGKSVKSQVCELDVLFQDDFVQGRWLTIGIGDGGNEVGMGKVHDLVRKHIKNGPRIGTVTSADHLIVSGVSNWAGYALAKAIALLCGDDACQTDALTDEAVLEAMVDHGCIDGMLSRADMYVDGFPYDPFHKAVIAEINSIGDKSVALYSEIASVSRVAARIDLGAISHNVSLLQKMAKDTGCKLMAIVKANAYGHGAVEVSQKLVEANGVDFFGVATLYEGIELRQNGILGRILVLGPSLEHEYAMYDKYGLEIMISGTSGIEAVGRFGLKCHIMLDTGMSRIGLDVVDEFHEAGGSSESYQGVMADAAADVVQQFLDSGAQVEALCTHMSTADPKYTIKQYERLKSVLEALHAKNIKIPMVHMENSNSLLKDLIPDQEVKDMLQKYDAQGYCRSGGGIYGQRDHPKLKPVVQVTSQVRHLHKVEKGDAVGYDRTWIAEKTTIIATLSVGFADGYPRPLSNKGTVSIKGKEYKIVGKVCMDMMMVDVGSDNEEVRVGDRVVLFGKGGPSLASLAKMIGTTQSDITCDLKPRVHRKYFDPKIAKGGGALE